MKSPADVRAWLERRYARRHRDWIAGACAPDEWPLEIALDVPGEQAAAANLEATRAWVGAWQTWSGPGHLEWTERRWRTLGTQRLPALLRLETPREVAAWLGSQDAWDLASGRQAALAARWPQLRQRLGRLFDVLATYPQADFERLVAVIAWLQDHPASGLYPRQLPIPGLDSKWLESRTALLAELLGATGGVPIAADSLYSHWGLRRPPMPLRVRLLDPALRAQLGGLGDVAAPVADLAAWPLRPRRVLIVENLQTALALDDLPDTVVFMALGYGVDVLREMAWLREAECLYWGDIDTHGLAILSRARAFLPGLRSVLMDEATLLAHRTLWTHEQNQCSADDLPGLTSTEQGLYRGLKTHAWGASVRLEQERIGWGQAWSALLSAC